MKNSPILIDVRQYACPMSSVHARIELDKLSSGDEALVYVKGDVARDNVKALLEMIGFKIIKISPLKSDNEWQVETSSP